LVYELQINVWAKRPRKKQAISTGRNALARTEFELKAGREPQIGHIKSLLGRQEKHQPALYG
jgi:hypothetical protein